MFFSAYQSKTSLALATFCAMVAQALHHQLALIALIVLLFHH